MKTYYFQSVLFFFIGIVAINSQTLDGTIVNNSKKVIYQITNLESVNDIPGKPDYRMLWIFGDGTYFNDPQRISIDSNNTSSHQIIHFYRDEGFYMPVVYSTDFYDDDDPPPSPMIMLTGNQGNQGPTGIYIGNTNGATGTTSHSGDIIDPNRFIKIDTNHHNRAGFESVFILSSKPDNDTKRILLFYGSKLNQQTATLSNNSFHYQRSHFANYSSDNLLEMKSAQAFDTNNRSNFGQLYDKVLEYEFDSTIIITENNIIRDNYNFEDSIEHRLFHVLKADTLLQLGDTYRFLAIITSENENPNVKNYNGWNDLIRPLLSEPKNNKSTKITAKEYVKDFYIMDLTNGGPHDPNNIKLTKVYKYGNNKYKLDFELETCNDGSGPAIYVNIDFIDQQSEYSKWIIDDVRFLGNRENNNSWDDSNTNPNIYQLELTNSITLPHKSILLPPPDSCAYIRFSVYTNSQGYQNFINRKSKMKACIKFEKNKIEECAFWQLDPSLKVDIVNCDQEIIKTNNSLYYILLFFIGILVLILVWCCYKYKME